MIHFINTKESDYQGHYAACGVHGGNLTFSTNIRQIKCKNCTQTKIFKQAVKKQLITLKLRIDLPLLQKQLAALECLNDNSLGDIMPRPKTDHQLLVGLENMLSEILVQGRKIL